MGKSSPSPPPTPNPQATAQAQGAANVDTAAAQAALNAVNQVTPNGSLTYSPTGSYTTPSGQTVPTYTATTTLSPVRQAILGQQEQVQGGLANLGNDLVNNSSMPLSQTFGKDVTANLPQIPGTNDLAGFAKDVAQKTYQGQANLLEPQLQMQQQQQYAQLANEGLAPGSKAYNNAQRQLQTNQDLALGAIASQAQGQGLAAENQIFGQGVTAQNQALNVNLTAQNQPINELSALLQGSPAIGMPQFGATPQTGVAPTDVLGAYGLQQQALNNQYQAQLANQSSILGGLAGLGGTLGAAYMLAPAVA